MGRGAQSALLLLLFVPGVREPARAWAQTPTPAQNPPTGSGSAQGSTARETRPLSEAERKELLGSVDGILAFASSDSGLAIRGKVGRRLVSRAEVTGYLQKQFHESESAKRLQRAELVLKKFGLLPREFDLGPFLLQLLTEQIAGYYDDKTKTVNLLNWVAPEDQRPVLAHELTHALQDQAVGLERWSDSGVHGVAHTPGEVAEHLRTDELETARSAVAEGQAMLVFTDYALRASHRTLLDSPEIVDRLLAANASEAESSPVLASAPRVLQDSLLFSYTDGLAFEAALLRAGGKQQAFAEALARPPASSYEVITPAAYLARRTAPVLKLPDIGAVLGRDYTPYDVGVLGELDVRILVETYNSDADAKAIAAKWDGGVYYAAQRHGAGDEQGQGTGSLGLIYLSRWTDGDAARSFAAMYREELSHKYRTVVPRAGEAGSDADSSASWFDTEEGTVLIAIHERSVFVAESFASDLEQRLRAEVLAVKQESMAPGAPAPEPSGTGDRKATQPMGRSLVSGLMRAAPTAHYTLLRRRLEQGVIETKQTRAERR